jgi:hypothetical protein
MRHRRFEYVACAEVEQQRRDSHARLDHLHPFPAAYGELWVLLSLYVGGAEATRVICRLV